MLGFGEGYLLQFNDATVAVMLYLACFRFATRCSFAPDRRSRVRLPDLFGQAMVGSGEDDPDVKALTIALVNGRIVDATIR